MREIWQKEEEVEYNSKKRIAVLKREHTESKQRECSNHQFHSYLNTRLLTLI